ncbi:hypothetical protein CCP1ISM_7390002 [Azospirillaceae bacterium]
MLGTVFTGMIVAGGSAGSLKLFQDILGFSKKARDAAKELRDLNNDTAKAEAATKLAQAQAAAQAAQAAVVKPSGA